MSKLDPFEVTM